MGLRDYGTATWVGVDPDCDHLRPAAHGYDPHATSTLGPNRDGCAPDNSAHSNPVKRQQYRDVCVKCGARRSDAQIGLEASPDAYIAELVAVFREVRRVLRDDGTLWLNLGDSYATGTVAPRNATSLNGPEVPASWAGRSQPERLGTPRGYKTKDLLMIPARVALALQADGWYLRSQLPWIKRSSMPESCTDRPSSAVEYVYLLTKSGATTFWVHRDKSGSRTQPAPDYRWLDHANDDAETANEPSGWRDEKMADGKLRWKRLNLWTGCDYFWDTEAVKRTAAQPERTRADAFGGINHAARGQHSEGSTFNGSSSRIFRNSDLFFDSLETPHGLITDADGNPIALDVNPAGFAEAHFATFPPNLVLPLVRASTSERGCCAACGAPWTRQLGKQYEIEGRGAGNGFVREHRISVGGRGDETVWVPKSRDTVGWQPSCQCTADVVPATVLDPFAGAFTAPMVADRLRRNAIGIELSETYCKMARERLVKDAGMFAELASD